MCHFVLPNKRPVFRCGATAWVSSSRSLRNHSTHQLRDPQIHLDRFDSKIMMDAADTKLTKVNKESPTWSHSSPVIGWAGAGYQPDRLATSRAAPGFHSTSLLDETVIWESGRSPDSSPCRFEHGASAAKKKHGLLRFRTAHAEATTLKVVTHFPTRELLSFAAGLQCWPLNFKSSEWKEKQIKSEEGWIGGEKCYAAPLIHVQNAFRLPLER